MAHFTSKSIKGKKKKSGLGQQKINTSNFWLTRMLQSKTLYVLNILIPNPLENLPQQGIAFLAKLRPIQGRGSGKKTRIF